MSTPALPSIFSLSKADREAERSLLLTLENLASPASLDEVMEKLRQGGHDFDDVAIREAMWRLLDMQRIVLTRDRKLQAALSR